MNEGSARQSGEEQVRFVGVEDSTVDAKGRVRLSKSKYEALGYNFYVRREEVGCLALYPLAEWNRKVDEIENRDCSETIREIAYDDLCSMAEGGVSCDTQGRFVVPRRFREDLGLDAEVAVVGSGPCIRIWKRSDFQDYRSAKRTAADAKRGAWESYSGLSEEASSD